MRIREIEFHNFRSFRGERRISFVDPQTDKVRPVSVLAGSNGSGKTTVLDTIEAVLGLVLDPDRPSDLVREAWKNGSIYMTIELAADEVTHPDGQRHILRIAVGRALPSTWSDLDCHLIPPDRGRPFVPQSPLVRQIRRAVSSMQQGSARFSGGLLYFPYDRRLGAGRGGIIEPPPEKQPWIFRFSPPDRWQGSLEQLWVWQNYLDLEQGSKEREHLQPFVESVETILGQDRPITIREGRVWVPTPWADDGRPAQVRLDQLPSGEQQVLLLFGELARRRRRGAVIAIDEVENSLHPTLQRLVMWNLRRIAREWDAQVIVATHSLEVINTVRGGAFINLDYPEDRFNLPVPEEGEEAIP